MVLMAYATRNYLIGSGWTLVVIPGFAMIALGAGIQLHIQQQRARDHNIKD
jgi:stage V sporulation protein SpoVS